LLVVVAVAGVVAKLATSASAPIPIDIERNRARRVELFMTLWSFQVSGRWTTPCAKPTQIKTLATQQQGRVKLSLERSSRYLDG
jgi:hypothetical protein